MIRISIIIVFLFFFSFYTGIICCPQCARFTRDEKTGYSFNRERARRRSPPPRCFTNASSNIQTSRDALLTAAKVKEVRRARRPTIVILTFSPDRSNTKLRACKIKIVKKKKTMSASDKRRPTARKTDRSPDGNQSECRPFDVVVIDSLICNRFVRETIVDHQWNARIVVYGNGRRRV